MPKKPIQIILIGIWLSLYSFFHIGTIINYPKMYFSQSAHFELITLISKIVWVLLLILIVVLIINFFRMKLIALRITGIYFLVFSLLGIFSSVLMMIKISNFRLLIILTIVLIPNALSIFYLFKKGTTERAKEFDEYYKTKSTIKIK